MGLTFPTNLSIRLLAEFLGISDTDAVERQARQVAIALARSQQALIERAAGDYRDLITAGFDVKTKELPQDDFEKSELAVLLLIALTQREYWTEEYLNNLHDALDWAVTRGFRDVEKAILAELHYFQWRQSRKRRRKTR